MPKQATSVTVTSRDGERHIFDAAHWHIDDRGQLHVNSSDEPQPLGSFHRDGWIDVTLNKAE